MALEERDEFGADDVALFDVQCEADPPADAALVPAHADAVGPSPGGATRESARAATPSAAHRLLAQTIVVFDVIAVTTDPDDVPDSPFTARRERDDETEDDTADDTT